MTPSDHPLPPVSPTVAAMEIDGLLLLAAMSGRSTTPGARREVRACFDRIDQINDERNARRNQ